MNFAESAGPIGVSVPENNKPAGILGSDLFHMNSQSSPPFPKEKSHPNETARPSAPAVQKKNNEPAGIIGTIHTTRAVDLPRRLSPKRKRILPNQLNPLGLLFKRTISRLGLLEVIHSIRSIPSVLPCKRIESWKDN